MITFKTFLLEGPYDPREISALQLIEWCNTNASAFLKIGKPIYRGMDTRGPFGIIDTNNFNRVAKNTRNYYNLWIDNHPAWKEFPKRAKSYICSTDRTYADAFGTLHLIIPSDKSRIGVCLDNDIWQSFSYLMPIVNHGIAYDMGTLMSALGRIIPAKYANTADTDYNALRDALSEITPDHLTKFLVDAESYLDKQLPNLWKRLIAENGGTSLLDIFDKYMDPKLNGFKTSSAGSFKFYPGVEVWIQGECAVVNIEHLRSPDNRETMDFLRERLGKL